MYPETNSTDRRQDYSTLNADLLRSQGEYVLPGSKHLQEGSGNGCAGDPPGYPTYFTRNVYTVNGNSPSVGVTTVITLGGRHWIVARANDNYENTKELLRRLWVPLSLNHPRTRAWIMDIYRHHRNCYNGHGEEMVIYPVPGWKIKLFQDDPRWNDTYREAAKAEVEAYNLQFEERYSSLATPDNHNAVRIIRKYYPEYQPELDLIQNPPEAPGLWWETLPEQPSEEDCAASQRWGHRHPFNTYFCQFCGRRYS